MKLAPLTKPIPGTLQEGGAPFQTTHWTVILQAGQAEADEAARKKALATFSETYASPLYTFVRRRGYSPANAQDIIQGFFVHLFEQNTLSWVGQESPTRGRVVSGAYQSLILIQWHKAPRQQRQVEISSHRYF